MQLFFHSSSHQRFENNKAVGDHQFCNRVVKVEPNLTGYRGYKLRPRDGVIVSIFNLDANHPIWGNNYQRFPNL